MFTGSDVTSSFSYISKKTWWKFCSEDTCIFQIFQKLSWRPNEVSESDFLMIEKLVCTVYDPPNRFKTNDVNKLRYLLFTVWTENNLRKLPPTKASLRLHVMRAAYAAGWVWGQSLISTFLVPSPLEWG